MAETKTSGLDRLKALIERIPEVVRASQVLELDAEGDELVDAMKQLVRRDSGRTADSIRKEPGQHELQVIVRAGGALTTKPVRKGVSAKYDYALAEEFGTRHAPAHPFFYPTYRAKRAAFRRRRTAAAKAAIEGLSGS